MTIKKFGDWDKHFARLKDLHDFTPVKKAVKREAVLLASNLKRNITTGGQVGRKPFAPLKESTILRKGSDAPLIDTSFFRNSITIQEQSTTAIFVGLPADKKHPSGSISVAMIGLIHEHGAILPNGVILVARPWFDPVVKATEEKRRERLRKRFEEILK